MKKTVVKGLIPLMAGAAVIGSGFSIWFFQEAKVSASQDLSKEVTQAAGVNTEGLAVADAIKVVFDQSKAGRTSAIGENTLKAEANGIYTVLGTNTKAVYTPLGSTGDIIDEGDGVYHQFTTTIAVTGGLADYIDIAYEGVTADTSTANSWKFALAKNINEFEWEKVTFSYKTGKEPLKLADYKTFKNVVTSSTITATYEVEVLGE